MDPESTMAYGPVPPRRDLQALRPQGPEAQAYLLSNLLPLQLQHLLLFVGVIHDVSAPNEQLALHGLGTQRALDTGFSEGEVFPALCDPSRKRHDMCPACDLAAPNKREFLPPASWAPAYLPLSAGPSSEKEREPLGGRGAPDLFV